MDDREADLGLVASSKRSAEDFLVGLCGLATSLITALLLWSIETRYGIAVYSWTLWFVIPAGAFLSGFAGASGYYAGSWFLGHRPTRLLLLNIVTASVATFFMVYYLSYITLRIDGKLVSDFIPFSQYLDIAIRSASVEFRFRGAVELGSTGELGLWGYAMAVLQIVGFAAGGFAVYKYLLSKPYCNVCSRYLTRKGKQIRYANGTQELQTATTDFLTHVAKGDFLSAIQEHKTSPAFSPSLPKGGHLRSVVEVRHCKKCEMHWVRFSVEKLSDNNWIEIPEITVAQFTKQIVCL